LYPRCDGGLRRADASPRPLRRVCAWGAGRVEGFPTEPMAIIHGDVEGLSAVGAPSSAALPLLQPHRCPPCSAASLDHVSVLSSSYVLHPCPSNTTPAHLLRHHPSHSTAGTGACARRVLHVRGAGLAQVRLRGAAAAVDAVHQGERAGHRGVPAAGGAGHRAGQQDRRVQPAAARTRHRGCQPCAQPAGRLPRVQRGG
jgi:hypothetical protein